MLSEGMESREGLSAEDLLLSVGELVIGYASRGVEMDHDLLYICYELTSASSGRQKS
jgi:hypothetical protein